MDKERRQSVSSLNIEILQKNKQTNGATIRYRSAAEQVFMSSIVCLCAIMFGYGLTEISTINIDVLITEYHINFSSSLAQGLLIGILPLGGIFGAILNKVMLQHFRRKTAIYLIGIFMILSVILKQITTVQTLFIGRFIEGICCGLYVSLGVIYLRQITARQIRSQLMSMFSLGKVLGIVLAYSLQQVLNAANYQYSWRILLAFNGMLCVVQVVLMFFFMPDSPVQMVEKADFERARKSILAIYYKQHVQDVLEQLKKDYAAQQARTKPVGQVSKLLSETVSYTKNRKRALLMGMHVIVLRQFSGGNCLVTFSGQIVSVFNKTEGDYTPLLINLIQFVTDIIAAFVVTKIFGRRPLLIIGTALIMVANFIIGAVLYLQLQIVIIVFMCIYMAIYGISFLPISWSYPTEIMPAEQSLVPNIVGWIATFIVVTVPPIVVGAMPNHNAYPLFFFFGIYCIFGLVVLILKMVESKGRRYEQIVKQF